VVACWLSASTFVSAAPMLAGAAHSLAALFGAPPEAIPAIGASSVMSFAPICDPSVDDRVAELVAKLKNQNDSADPKILRELSGLKSREAMSGLVEVYDVMHTHFMKREIVRALVDFDGVADAEQPALQKIMDVATTSEEPELRDAALDALAECKAHGRDFLMLIVRSPADDKVREKAMQLHVANASPDDESFYRELYKPKSEEKGGAKDTANHFAKHDINKVKADKEKEKEKKKANADENAPKKARSLPVIRSLAFQALTPTLAPDEIIDATKDDSAEIRAQALLALESRGVKQALEIATATMGKSHPPDPDHMDKRTLELDSVRAAAVKIVGRLQGVKAAPDLMKLALASETPAEVQQAIAEVMVSFNDAKLNKDLVEKLSKPRFDERYVALWAARAMKDEKLSKPIAKLMWEASLVASNGKPADKTADDARMITVLACQTLAARGDKDAIPDIQKIADKCRDRACIRAALDALVILRGNDPAWIEELVKMTKHEDAEVRALALTALGRTNDKAQVAKLAEALNDPSWSTRLATLEGLESIHARESIGPIIARMGKEEGRILRAFVDTLWRMTGQPFDDKAEAWSNWWKANGESFQPLSVEQVKKLEVSEAEWRMKQTTHVETRSFEDPAAKKTKFFGIRIISHHVLFIIDVSGSMNETIASEYDGKTGHTRMDVAKSELAKCIQGLEPTAFFNIVTFSSDVKRWFEGRLAAASPKNLDDAKSYVSKLLPFGGTNTYGALREAFKDPDVDTIFFMSDGEPSVGDVIDPVIIREHVKQWNEHRDITIHTIAVGGKFEVLQWLADDSGGTAIKYD
jgi:HEAT repeat protein